MIYNSLDIIKTKLNEYLKGELPLNAGETDRAVFVDESDNNELQLTDGAINIALLNVREESMVRIQSFQTKKVPDIGIYLDVFFIAAVKNDYAKALQLLSYTVQFFKNNRTLDLSEVENLSDNMCSLIIELQSLEIPRTREAWQIMEYMKNKPSLLYKIKLLIFNRTDAVESDVTLSNVSIETNETLNNTD